MNPYEKKHSRLYSKKIFVGKTTQEQVKVHFGNPIETSYSDNGSLEIWKYKFSNVSLDFIGYVPVVNWFASSSSGKEKTLTILFDENSIVKRFSITDSDVKVKTGLINN